MINTEGNMSSLLKASVQVQQNGMKAYRFSFTLNFMLNRVEN